MAFLGSIREKREKHREEKRLLLLNDIYNPGTVKLVKKYGDPVSVSDMLYQSDNGAVVRQTNSYAEFLRNIVGKKRWLFISFCEDGLQMSAFWYSGSKAEILKKMCDELSYYEKITIADDHFTDEGNIFRLECHDLEHHKALHICVAVPEELVAEDTFYPDGRTVPEEAFNEIAENRRWLSCMIDRVDNSRIKTDIYVGSRTEARNIIKKHISDLGIKKYGKPFDSLYCSDKSKASSKSIFEFGGYMNLKDGLDWYYTEKLLIRVIRMDKLRYPSIERVKKWNEIEKNRQSYIPVSLESFEEEDSDVS